MKNFNKIKIGIKGENVATDYLLQKGYTIMEKNWRYKNFEIDIIAMQKNKLHFVEVKTRTTQQFGNPEESIDARKMNALKRAAEAYLLTNNIQTYIQFDVIAIKLNVNTAEEIFFIEDVFF